MGGLIYLNGSIHPRVNVQEDIIKMLRRLALCFALLSTLLVAQKRPSEMVNATKDDWEEINFEYKSALITDGFPSLLTLADLLKKNPGYRVRIVGHTDMAEGNNKRLALCRAQSVQQFLVKYGANMNQTAVEGIGNTQPKIPGQSRAYRATDVARWMARRAEVFVTDDKGNKVGQHDGSIKDAISGMQAKTEPAAARRDCCDDILARLDRIEKLLGDKMAELDRKLADADKGRGAQEQQVNRLAQDVGALPKQVADQVEGVKRTVTEEIQKAQPTRYSPIAVNLGSDDRGNVIGSARGQYFTAFNRDRTGIQLQGEYMYWKDRQEGQFDAGLVNRFGNVQIGGFGSFKYVNLREFESGGTLGQAAILADYLFPIGRLGIYGTKAFMNNAVIDRRQAVVGANGQFLDPRSQRDRNTIPAGARLLANTFRETYLRVADTYGGSGAFKLIGPSYIEGNIGFSRTLGNETVTGGTGRVVVPINARFAFTAEGGVNETLVNNNFNYSRVAFGFQMGNFLTPGGLRAAGVSPMDVPRVRYELLTRTVRSGNSAPVADAGGDQVGINAGTVTLNGTGSYDPDGDTLTYEWTQVAGPSVPLTGATTATAQFTATAGQQYSFRLTVRDSFGLSSIARANVSTRSSEPPVITRFSANPGTIRAGQSTTLSWAVRGATEVSIDGIGRVNNESGNVVVSPTQNTTYRLVARNAAGLESVETVSVTVESPAVTISDFRATPTTIVTGETATLAWATRNATEVNISGVGPVQPSGNIVVSPTQTTTYTLTATGPGGQVERSSVNIVVVPRMERPRIITFAANPVNIIRGSSSRLSWNVEGADEVVISNLGRVALTGDSEVRPQQTTTYVLTATNRAGVSTQQVTVSVGEPTVGDVTLTNCVADPPVIQRVGDASALKWTTTNAASVVVAGAGPAQIQGGFVVRPLSDTTYRIVATGINGSTATCSVTVRLASQTAPPQAVIAGPAIITTTNRTVTLDGSGSTGTGLTYAWRNIGQRTGTITAPTSAVTQVELSGPAGDFQFELTVTNNAGQSSRALVTIRYVVPGDPLP